VLADGAKWGRASLAHICPADRAGVLITDPGAPGGPRAALAERGVLVHVAVPLENR
jgi:DeoR/GlpR family transcriptional regulator of sugar metabolism